MRSFIDSAGRLERRNTDFRRVLFTGSRLQLVVMCLKPGESIGREVHRSTDQFFRIEEGVATFILEEMGRKRVREVRPGGMVVVPAGTYHDVVNRSKTRSVKLSTIYAPPKHEPGLRQHSRSRKDERPRK